MALRIADGLVTTPLAGGKRAVLTLLGIDDRSAMPSTPQA
jgi:hypothetical protein